MNIPERRTPDETRARILAVAWDLFRQLGSRATIADVAEQLGMSSANVYRFYSSKQALCEAVCSNQLGAMLEAAREVAAAPGKPSERLRGVLLTLHIAMRDQMTNEARVHEIVDIAINEHWAPIGEFEQSTCEILAHLIAQGQGVGEFGPGDPIQLGMLTICACAGVHHPTMIAQYRDVDGSSPPEAIIDFALRALGNPHPRSLGE